MRAVRLSYQVACHVDGRALVRYGVRTSGMCGRAGFAHKRQGAIETLIVGTCAIGVRTGVG